MIYEHFIGTILTEEEQKRFINMNVFDRIKGNDQTRIEWLNTIYHSYLYALGYKPIGWREPEEKQTDKVDGWLEDLKMEQQEQM